MKEIAKFLLRLLVIIVVMILVLVLGRNYILPPIISTGVRAATGLGVRIGSMDIGLVNTYVHINDLQLLNPPGFADPVMVAVPEIKADYVLREFLHNKVHLQSATFALQEVCIIKNADGTLNIEALRALRNKQHPPAEQPKERKPMALQIDELHVRIGKVTFKDYSGGGAPRVSEIPLNIDERFTNVTDPEALTLVLVAKIMTRAGLGGLLKLDVSGLAVTGLQELGGAAGAALQNVATNVTGQAGKILEDAAGTLKKALPFGR